MKVAPENIFPGARIKLGEEIYYVIKVNAKSFYASKMTYQEFLDGYNKKLKSVTFTAYCKQNDVKSHKYTEPFEIEENEFSRKIVAVENNKNVYAIIVGGVFVGEEKYKNILLENINKSPFKDRIIYSDYRNDTEAIHKLFDIFVLPSINPDPLPTVVLEAMATGKPIVGYAHGGVCEMVKNGVNGLLVEPRNPDLLANAINKLLQNKKLCKS